METNPGTMEQYGLHCLRSDSVHSVQSVVKNSGKFNHGVHRMHGVIHLTAKLAKITKTPRPFSLRSLRPLRLKLGSEISGMKRRAHRVHGVSPAFQPFSLSSALFVSLWFKTFRGFNLRPGPISWPKRPPRAPAPQPPRPRPGCANALCPPHALDQ